MYATFFVRTFNKMNLITTKQTRIKKNRIMRIKNQLCLIFVYIIIMEYINNIHQCHRMNRRIKLIHYQRCPFSNCFNNNREPSSKTQRTKRLIEFSWNSRTLFFILLKQRNQSGCIVQNLISQSI